MDRAERRGPRIVLRSTAVLGIIGIGVLLAVQHFELVGADNSVPVAHALGPLDASTARIGDTAPDFALETLDGTVVRLSDFRGRTVIVNFWATWCLPCYLEMPELQALYEERLPAEDLVVLAINVTPQDSREAVRGFVAEGGLTFPVLIETDELDVARRYELERLPGTFFIDRDGVLREISYGLMVGDALMDRVERTDAHAD